MVCITIGIVLTLLLVRHQPFGAPRAGGPWRLAMRASATCWKIVMQGLLIMPHRAVMAIAMW